MNELTRLRKDRAFAWIEERRLVAFNDYLRGLWAGLFLGLIAGSLITLLLLASHPSPCG